jgi:hypothetical protein
MLLVFLITCSSCRCIRMNGIGNLVESVLREFFQERLPVILAVPLDLQWRNDS